MRDGGPAPMDEKPRSATLGGGESTRSRWPAARGSHPRPPRNRETTMTVQSIARRVGPLSMIAAALIIVSQGVHLALGLALGAQPADNVLHSVKYVLALLAMFALLLAL